LNWLKDNLFRRLVKNASILITGSVFTAGIDLVSLAVTARALGPELFGVLVLVQTYVRFVNQFVNFQSWQAIIKYGADTLTAKRTSDFRSLIKLGTSLDIIGSLLGTTFAISSVYWAGRWFEWEDSTVLMAAIYSLTILFSLSPTPTAVLRLFDRFKLLAWQRVISAAIRMAALLLAWIAGAGIWGFFVVWMVAQILDYLFLLTLGWRELRRQNYGDALLAPLERISTKFPGIWKFVITTNLSSSIRLGARELDVLIVGGVIGSAAAGIYKVAKQFAGVPVRFADPLQQAIYPDMARLWAEGQIAQFRRTLIRMGVLCGLGGIAIWLGFLLLGEWVIRLTVGPEYISAYEILLVYMLGINLFMFGIAFRPTVLSMGHPGRILQIYIISTIMYLVALVLLLGHLGLMGAAVANIVFHSIWFVTMSLSIWVYLGREGGVK